MNNTTEIKMKYLKIGAIILPILGIIVSGYLWYNHNVLLNSENGDGLIPCTFGNSFNCDIVNSSSYSEIYGVPIAGLGLLSYVIVLLIALWKDARKWGVLLGVTGLMSLYSISLFYISKFVIGSYCIFCIVSYAITFGLLGIAYLGFSRTKGSASRD